MPLPLIPLVLGAAALASAVFGAKKGLDAKSDFDSAKHLNNEAKKLLNDTNHQLESARDQAQQALEHLGELKFGIYEDSMIPFVESFSKIKNINFNDKYFRGVGKLSPVTSAELKEMKKTTLEIKEVVSGGVAALGSGGLAGLAAYGGVGMLASASTGTAISTLSGVAATNATLAWLGGGSLATGGLGMAGGMCILGGVVAGPVLAITGMMLASKAEAAKYDAYANYDVAQQRAEEIKLMIVATEGIRLRFNEINLVLKRLNDRFIPLLASLEELVSSNNNYSTYSQEDKKGVFMTASLAKTIKSILEAPLIDKTGALTPESSRAIKLAEKTLASIL